MKRRIKCFYSQAVVERLFSLLKINVSCSSQTYENEAHVLTAQLIRVCLEGPPLESFDATKQVENWWREARKRTQKGKRKRYAPRKEEAKKKETYIATLAARTLVMRNSVYCKRFLYDVYSLVLNKRPPAY